MDWDICDNKGAYPIQVSQYLQREIPVQLRLFENIMNEKEVIRCELIHVQFKPQSFTIKIFPLGMN